ncbi:hypothetical protein, partial [Micrococcus luteus]|uniref:hypothetical protein n=1 Tax=Micrococcus luteus TaxID=1270 RepID=UPI00164363B5
MREGLGRGMRRVGMRRRRRRMERGEVEGEWEMVRERMKTGKGEGKRRGVKGVKVVKGLLRREN